MITSGMAVLTPRFASLDGEKEHTELERLFLRSLSVSAVLAFGVSMLAIIFGGRFITWWVGEEFTKAIPVLRIIAIAYGFALSQNPSINLMYALKKHHYYAVATIIEAVANIVISILLAPRYGIIGVAIGTMIPALILKMIVMPVYMSKIMSIRIISYLKPLVTPCILAGLMIVLANILGVFEFLDECRPIVFLLCGITTGLGFLITSYLLSQIINPWLTDEKTGQA